MAMHLAKRRKDSIAMTDSSSTLDTVATLRELCEAFGPAGFEEEVRAIVRRLAEPLADSVEETPLGNLIVRRAATARSHAAQAGAAPSSAAQSGAAQSGARAGSRAGARAGARAGGLAGARAGAPATPRAGEMPRTLLLDAHLDEVGLIVSYVEDRGFLRFATLGGIDPRVLPSQTVLVRAADGLRHRGVIGVLPPHVTQPSDRDRAFKIEDLFIDLGYDSRAAAEALGIGVGAPAVVDGPFRELGDGCVVSRALDDRAGCTIALAVLAALRGRDLPVNLVVSFSAQEELGGFGASTLLGACRPLLGAPVPSPAHGVNCVSAAPPGAGLPDLAIVLEGTTGTDTPGVPPPRVVAGLRRGPALTIADNQIVVPDRVVRALKAAAGEAGVPFQIKTPRFGGTNARAIQTLGAGIPTGIVAVPCRYIHSNASVLCLDDLRHAIALVTRFVETAGGGLLATPE
jgi:endoglucanase